LCERTRACESGRRSSSHEPQESAPEGLRQDEHRARCVRAPEVRKALEEFQEAARTFFVRNGVTNLNKNLDVPVDEAVAAYHERDAARQEAITHMSDSPPPSTSI
jgi:hypothetical protein